VTTLGPVYPDPPNDTSDTLRSAHVRLALAPATRPHPRPGGGAALIILAVTAALWFYVFPWASLHLPIDSSGFNG